MIQRIPTKMPPLLNLGNWIPRQIPLIRYPIPMKSWNANMLSTRAFGRMPKSHSTRTSNRSYRKAKAASLSCYTRTFYPDPPSHRFHQLFANVESQTRSSHLSNQVAFETHEFLKEERNVRG